jgi:serine protease Do
MLARPCVASLLIVFALSTTAAAQLRQAPPTFAPTVAAIKAAVYSLEVPAPAEQGDGSEESSQPSLSEFLRKIFGGLPEGKLGAAVMIDPSGIAVTSARLVRGLTDVELVAIDGERYAASVAGRDERTDIAVLKVGVPTPRTAASLGDSDETRVGDWVMAVGSPYGFESSVSAGIISGRPRVSPEGGYEDSLLTDAAVNPGSLGGPLVDTRGVVVGLIVTPGPRSSGIAFAVPSNTVRRVSADLLARGKVRRGWLGIVAQEVTPELAQAFGAPVIGGILAADVVADGPAARAGIVRGTLVLAIDDRVLRTPADLDRHLARTVPGQPVKVRLWRERREQTFVMAVADEPVPYGQSMAAAQRLGLLVDALTPEAGVVVVAVRPGSGAAVAEIWAGDLVRELDGHPITTLADFERATRRLQPGHDVTVLVQRGPRTFYVVVAAAPAPTVLGRR